MKVDSIGMRQQLLWVDDLTGREQKSADSARKRQARIRSHVQSHRTSHAAESFRESALIQSRTGDLSPSKRPEGVLASSFRPDKSLSRPAATSKGNGPARKRRKTTCKELLDSKDVPWTKNDTNIIRSLPFLWHGLTAQERCGLVFFQLRTSREWSGWEDAHFWNTLAPQVSQQSQTVARSLVAISNLHERMVTVGSAERALLERQSCEQSGKATRALVSKSEILYFEALVSCLIMICFHGLQQNQASFMLLRSGVKLLAECNDPGRASLEERQIVELHIRPLFSRLFARPCSMVDMPQTFKLSIKLHRANPMRIAAEKPRVPCVFNTLSEARNCLRDIFDWAHDNYPSSENPISSTHYFLNELHQLSQGWQSSLAVSQFSKIVQSIDSQNLLKAACLAGIIVINTAHSFEECIFDRYLSNFEEIVRLVQSARLPAHSFGIDAGLFDIISFVGSKCRDPHIRRKALRFLRSWERLEGDRIAANPAAVLEALIALEERDMEVGSCHDVPEHRRRRLVYGEQHTSQGRISLFFASSDKSQRERCLVSLARLHTEKRSQRSDRETNNVPDAIFGTGYAAYLEDRATMKYFRIELEKFYFPMPRA